jgi:hypothetical protein
MNVSFLSFVFLVNCWGLKQPVPFCLSCSNQNKTLATFIISFTVLIQMGGGGGTPNNSRSWEEDIYWTHFQFIHFAQFLSTDFEQQLVSTPFILVSFFSFPWVLSTCTSFHVHTIFKFFSFFFIILTCPAFKFFIYLPFL